MRVLLGFLLTVSVLLNVWLMLPVQPVQRLPARQPGPTAQPRVPEPSVPAASALPASSHGSVQVVADPRSAEELAALRVQVGGLAAQLDVLGEELRALASRQPPASEPAESASDAMMPGVGGEVLFELLLHDAQEQLEADLRRLREVAGQLERPAYLRALLERSARFLSLDGPAGEAFIADGVAAAEQLGAASDAYAAAHKQAFIDAEEDWTRAEVPADETARWQEAQRRTQEVLQRHLDPEGDARHRWFADQLDTFVLFRLAPSGGGFSWR